MLSRGLGKRIAFAAAALVLCAGFALCALQVKRRAASSNGSEPYEVVIENLTLGQDMPDLPLVEEAVNAITVPALNCRVRIMNIPISSQKSALRLMRARNERVDLVNTGRTDPLTDMVSDGLLIPLDELLASHGPALLEANRALLEACRVNGRLYAIPSSVYKEDAVGFMYNASMARDLGISLSESPDLEELEQVAEVLHQHGKYILLPNANAETPWLFTSLYPGISPVSNNLYYGVLGGDSSPWRVVNAFETGEFMDYCLRMRRWVERGWIPDQFLLSGLSGSREFTKGNVFLSWSGVEPATLALESRNYPFDIGMFATGRRGLATRTVLESGWGISPTSQDPEAAMRLLDFIYTHENVANLLMNGLEGREYRKVSDHIIACLEGQSAADLKYARQFTSFGDYRKVFEWEPMTEADYQALQEYYAPGPTLSPLFGYSFDVQPVSNEASAVFEVLTSYLPALECGLISDVPSAIEALNQQLRHAGMDRILAENQRQLDAWLSTRPDA